MANYITSFIASTLNNSSKELYNQWLAAYPGWYQITKKPARPVPAGLNIVENVIYDYNSSVDFRDAKASIPLNEDDDMRNVAYAWKTISGGLPIYDADELLNAGKEQVFDYTQAKIENLMRTMRAKLAAGLYGAGGNDILDGLNAICSASNTYPVADDKTQIAGILRTTAANAWWRANVYSTTEPWSISGGTDGGWTTPYHACCIYEGDDPNEEPDLIITTEALFNKYMDTLADNQRFESEDLASHGFRSLKFRNAAVVWDNNVTTGYTYILNTKHIFLRPHTACNGKFIVKEKHPMETLLADRILMMWMGNLTCKMPRKQAITYVKS